MIDNCSLLIQGTPHLNSIFKIDYYSQFFNEIIYSSYPFSEPINNIIKNMAINLQNKCRIVLNSYKHNFIYNKQNIGYQALTTKNGLSHITNKYVLKIRTDEYFNLDNLCNLIDISKINFSSIYFRHHSEYRYHVSDHIIFGPKNLLTDVFDLIYKACTNDEFNEKFFLSIQYKDVQNISLVPEQIICASILKTILNNDLIINYNDLDKNIDYFHKYFNIIDVEQLRPYVISAKNLETDQRCYYSDVSKSHFYFESDCKNIKEYV